MKLTSLMERAAGGLGKAKADLCTITELPNNAQSTLRCFQPNEGVRILLL